MKVTYDFSPVLVAYIEKMNRKINFVFLWDAVILQKTKSSHLLPPPLPRPFLLLYRIDESFLLYQDIPSLSDKLKASLKTKHKLLSPMPNERRIMIKIELISLEILVSAP